MTAEPRPIRDILAECIVSERLGLHMMAWAKRSEIHDEACEQDRIRADKIMRMLAARGVSLVQTGDPEPALPAPTGDVIYRYKLAGRDAERLIRRRKNLWQIVTVADGSETVEQEFTMTEAARNGSLVLIDSSDAQKIKGLGRQLAAVNEIYRMGAEEMTS